jgi:hypothetical protein
MALPEFEAWQAIRAGRIGIRGVPAGRDFGREIFGRDAVSSDSGVKSSRISNALHLNSVRGAKVVAAV